MDPCRVGLWSVLLLFGTIGADPSYIVHLNRVSFTQALEACRPGVLTTIATETEVTEVLRAVSRSGLSQNQFHFWVGLRRNKNECVFPALPLRGFRWTSDGSQDSQVSRWLEEPRLTCTTVRCATLTGETNGTTVTRWGLVPVTCRNSYSFICKRTPEDQKTGGSDATTLEPDTTVTPGPDGTITPGPDGTITPGSEESVAQKPELPTPGTEPEPEKDVKFGPEPGPKLGSDSAGESDSCQKLNIPGTRALSLDPGTRGWVQVECWSQVQVELRCLGSPGTWRFPDDSVADLSTVCQSCEDGLFKDANGRCVDRDECAGAPCRTSGTSRTTCLNTVGSFRCVCTDESGNHHDQDSPLCLQAAAVPQPLVLGLVVAAALVVLVVVAAVTVKCCLKRREKNKDGGESLETANQKAA